MSGEIIDFRSLHEQRRAKLYRRQPVPRAPAGRPMALADQIDRIMGLLRELEALTRHSRDLPSTLRLRARASIDLASGVLDAVRGEPEENGADDPQPEVDREILERMYRDLDLHA